MNYENIRLYKSMYQVEGGFSRNLEALDPSKNYTGTELAGLDAFQRQLKRFDIKVAGAGSDVVAKFFQTSDSATLFPEYIARAVSQGARDASILDEIAASKTEIDSLDYRSIVTDLSDKDYADAIAEGAAIPETNITLSNQLVKLKKRGRMLRASYESIKFQRVDVVTVALKQIGAYISKAQLKDAVDLLINGLGAVPAAEVVTAGATLSYADLLSLWGKFNDFDMSVLLASPDMAQELLALPEMRDAQAGLSFHSTGDMSTPFGAKLLRSNAVPAGKIIALDKSFALEMVTAGGVSVEYDKLIDCQLERAAVTQICGFNKVFPEAVKVLAKA